MTRMLNALRQVADTGASTPNRFPGFPENEVPAEPHEGTITPDTCAARQEPRFPAKSGTREGRDGSVEGEACLAPAASQAVLSVADPGRLPPDADQTAGAEIVHSPEYSRIAASLLRDFPPGRPGVLLLTSPELEGISAGVAAALADALASQVTGEIFAASLGEGSAFVLRGGEIGPFAEAIHAAARQESQALGTVLGELRRAYQLVLVDASPAHSPVARAVARCADGAYLVIHLGRTGRRAARQAVAAIRDAGGRVLGCITVQAGPCSPRRQRTYT